MNSEYKINKIKFKKLKKNEARNLKKEKEEKRKFFFAKGQKMSEKGRAPICNKN